jgi:acetoin utilization protein AcuB
MTRNVVVLEEWENLLDVARDMKRHHLRHLPVVDAGKLVGLVSHRDLLGFAASQLDPRALAQDHDQNMGENTFVHHVMTRNVTTATPTTTIAEAARLLSDGRFGCLPVIQDDELVGIVTEHDLLKLLASRKES